MEMSDRGPISCRHRSANQNTLPLGGRQMIRWPCDLTLIKEPVWRGRAGALATGGRGGTGARSPNRTRSGKTEPARLRWQRRSHRPFGVYARGGCLPLPRRWWRSFDASLFYESVWAGMRTLDANLSNSSASLSRHSARRRHHSRSVCRETIRATCQNSAASARFRATSAEYMEATTNDEAALWIRKRRLSSLFVTERRIFRASPVGVAASRTPYSFSPLPGYGCVFTQWLAMSTRRVIHTPFCCCM